MPKYTFKCESCNTTRQLYISMRTNCIVCKECDSVMIKQMPRLNGPADVHEVVNKYTGQTWKQDQQESVQERRQKYYWEVEVPRLVNSGTYSLETMLENGWVYFNEKEELCINNKPPSER